MQLSSYSYFSYIDLNPKYYQLEPLKETIPPTFFLLDDRQLEFVWMLFRSKNAPYYFQKATINLFGELEYLKVYMDDVLIHSKGLELHCDHISEFLQKHFLIISQSILRNQNVLKKKLII